MEDDTQPHHHAAQVVEGVKAKLAGCHGSAQALMSTLEPLEALLLACCLT